MKKVMLNLGRMLLVCIYTCVKLCPVNHDKIVFLSRQSSNIPLDFRLLQDELMKRNSELCIVTICNRIENSVGSRVSFVRDLFRSLYHLATSRVCILDSYWPAVSLLNHKELLTVIQIWHAVGKIKQSGLITVGRPGGRSEETAHALRMHENYDYIVAGAPIWNKCYCESFGCSEDKLLNIGLPRLDVIVSPPEGQADTIRSQYPELLNKKIVLYAPTFRRTGNRDHADLVDELVDRGYALIVKAHPNQALETHRTIQCNEYSAMDLLCVADYVITDYSAIALEAAAANVRTIYYLYDFDEYREKTGLNIDIPSVMPGCVFYDVRSLADGLDAAVAGEYPVEVFDRYRATYLVDDLGHSTADLASFILGCMKEKSASSKDVVLKG